MKLISSTLGRIIVVLAAIALVVGMIAVSSTPINTFFQSIMDTTTQKASDMMNGITTPMAGEDGAGGAGGAGGGEEPGGSGGEEPGGEEPGGAGGSGGETDSTDYNLNPSGVIPKGATLIRYENPWQTYDDATGEVGIGADSYITYNAGDNFPELTLTDDGAGSKYCYLFTYGGHQYCYGYLWCSYCDGWSNICGCNFEYDGWGHKILESTDLPMVESINGKSISDEWGY